MLTEFYMDLYGLPEDERQHVKEEREHWMHVWLDLQGDVRNPLVTRAKLDKALSKLKGGKSSPDGITAEVLKALPAECKDELRTNLVRRWRTLEFPTEWTRSMTTLAPKVIGATTLAKFRPTAGLCAMRKLLGYIWMLSLPALTLVSAQTAFIPGSHADTGV